MVSEWLCVIAPRSRAAGKYQRSIDVESSDDEELFGQKPKVRGLDHLVAAQISTSLGVKPWDNDGIMMLNRDDNGIMMGLMGYWDIHGYTLW